MEITNEIIRSLGMTMVHSLWQGAIISVVIAFLLGLTPKSNARIRYHILFSGLLLLLAGFLSTFFILYRSSHSPVLWGGLTAAALPFDQTVTWNWPGIPSRFTSWLFLFLEPAYPVLALGWVAGFLFLGLRSAGGLVISRRNLRKGLTTPDATLQMIFDRLQVILDLPVMVKFRITTRMISPLVIGFLKPVVVIPAAAISGLSTAQIEAVMVHELAHIRRFDHILILLQAFAGQMLFFHPAVWFLMPEIDRERENCCDDYVLKNDNNPINYIKALTMIQEMNLNSPVPANALTGKPNQLLNRIKRLVKPERKHSAAFRLTVMLLFLATIGVSAMTLFLAGKPGDLSNEVNTTTIDRKNGEKKKMKIVFSNDTIKEITVNGKTLNKEEMKAYQEEIEKIRQEMEASQRELEKTQKELQEAQLQLEFARQQMEAAHESMVEPDLSGLDLQLERSLAQKDINLSQLENMKHQRDFQEQMKRAQEDARRAFEEMKIREKENWLQHQEEFRQQMKKAQEEAWKAMEDFKKNQQNFFNQNKNFFEEHPELPLIWDRIPPVPPVPEYGMPEAPDVDELMPEPPEHPLEIIREEPAIPEDQPGESLDSKLREVEEE
jgi:bla regulator protein blaR1